MSTSADLVTTMTQEKARELLTGLTQTADGRKTSRTRSRIAS